MVNFESRRLRRIVSVVLTVVLMVTLLSGKLGIVNAEYTDTTSLVGILSNVNQELIKNKNIEATAGDVNTNGEIKIHNSVNVKELLGATISDETGSKEMLKNIMSGNGSITVNGKTFDFSMINDAGAVLSTIALISNNANIEDYYNVITASDTGIIIALNDNVNVLDEMFYFEDKNGVVSITDKWEALLGVNYDDASHEARREASTKLLQEILNNAKIYNGKNVTIDYDGQTVTTNINIASKVTFDYGYDNKTEDKFVANGTLFDDIKPENDPERAGYELKGWSVDTGYTINEDITITAEWEAQDVNYTINVYEMSTNKEYMPVGSITAQGKTDSKINKDSIVDFIDEYEKKEGFTLNEDKSQLDDEVTILADASSSVNIFYDRNKYKLAYIANETKTEEEYYYGEKVVLRDEPEYKYDEENPETTYVFVGWKKTESKSYITHDFIMPAEDYTLEAIWAEENNLYMIKEKIKDSKDEYVEDKSSYDVENGFYWYNNDVKIEPNTDNHVTKILEYVSGNEYIPKDSLDVVDEGKHDLILDFVLESGKQTETTDEKYPVVFGIDKTSPNIEVNEDIIDWTEKNNVVFKNITDELSGVSKIEVSYIHKDASLNINEGKYTYEIIEGITDNYTETVPWENLADGTQNVTIKVYDLAGNEPKEAKVEVQKDTAQALVELEEDTIEWTEKNNVVFKNIIDELSGVSKIEVSYIHKDASLNINEGKYTYEIIEGITDNYTETVPWENLADGTQNVTIKVYDLAGNEPKEAKVEVQKDTSKPNITITEEMKTIEWGDKSDVVFENINDIATNKIGGSGELSGIASVVINYGGENGHTKSYPNEDRTDLNGDYTLAWNDLPDGEYEVTILVTDIAGNSKGESVKVQKDTKEPELRVTAVGSAEKDNWESYWTSYILTANVNFLHFSNVRVDVTLDYNDPKPTGIGGDKISGIQKVQRVVLNQPMATITELDNLQNWETVVNNTDTNVENGRYEFDIDTDSNRNAIVYVKVIDHAGNVKYGSSNGIVIDKRDPKPEIVINIEQSKVGYYNKSVPVTYTVTDPKNGEAYSGLKTVTYEIINSDDASKKVRKTLAYKAEDHVETTNAQKVTISGSSFNSNNVTFKVTATDNAGNTSTKEQKLKIDTTAPSISVSYANAKHQNEYYRENRVATITITERNFDANNVDISITKDGTQNSKLANVKWTKTAGTGNGDNTKHTATITYSADGDYTFDIECTDKAGNKNSKVKYSGGNENKFTVDKTLPIVTVTYDNTPKNGKYYKSDVNAKIVIKEHNFNAKATKLTTTGASSVGKFTKTGTDEYTAIVEYSNENECTFDIEFSDKAGNAAKYNDQTRNNRNNYALDEFVVDKTAPKDIVFTTAANSANNGTATATFDFSENYFSDNRNPIGSRREAVDISINGYKNGDVTEDFPFTLSTRGGKVEVKFGDFPREIQWDDVYTITTTVTDLAGNETSGEIVFSVNRFGSNYVFGKSTEELVNNYYTNTPQKVEVYEISASTKPVEDYTISVIINGERKELVEGTDFTVDHNWKVEYPEDYDVNSQDNNVTITGDMLKEVGASAANGWKINHYVINPENFGTEGEYTVLISSTDTAGNSMASNTSKYESSKNVGFVYDSSLPEWYIKNSDENRVYKGATYEFQIAVSDDVSSVSKVEVTYKGETKVYEAKDIKDGFITFKATESFGSQELEIVVTDKAGNVTAEDRESRIYEFRLTSNPILQFFYLYWFYLLIGLLAVAAGIVVIVILKKRKKEESK